MYRLLRQFARDEQGQDLLEFALMLAFVFLASAALYVSSR
jgi:Flp pilus assembly pilin Flp